MGLEDDPFSVQHTKSGMLRIFRGPKVVVTLGGQRPNAWPEAAAESEDARQQLLAHATSNYRRGNERTVKRS